MAIANNLLLAHNIPQHEALDVLLRWLSSTITTPKFLEKQAFPVEDMRLALERAVGEIVERLNPELFSYIELAWSREYRVDVDEEEMYAERTVEWESVLPAEIQQWDEAQLKWYLKEARAEIRWLRNEIGRLDVHLKNAAALKAEKERRSFDYHPMPRWPEEC